MSRVRVCLFVLFLVLNITVQFGDCEDTTNNVNCDAEVSPGSDKTRVLHVEWPLAKLKKSQKENQEHTKNIFQTYFIRKDFNAERPQNDKVSARFISSSGDESRNVSSFFIFPGTLWCGNGDRANNDADLGKFNKTDACCRAHDKCENNIPSGDTKLNLKNNGLFTRSACACDKEFYKCLKNANSILSKGIGKTYFNILNPQCFSCVCPENGCNASTSSSECKDQCRRYQWNDSPRF
ncbi:phospholipase A2 [Linepithema humile]|uniref:phospholipase A2 n=1 Tax=Linepithema humile TaxID=83485 RepID=UPI0006237100|nr:PREDICTED: phospholipase A2-like [Linepithema humile]